MLHDAGRHCVIIMKHQKQGKRPYSNTNADLASLARNLYGNEFLSDYKLVIVDTKHAHNNADHIPEHATLVPVHGLILCAASEFFRAKIERWTADSRLIWLRVRQQ